MPNFIHQSVFPFIVFSTAFCLIPEATYNSVYRIKALPTAVTKAIDPPAVKTVEQAAKKPDEWRKLDVVATAYNSLAAQTDSTPDIAAWGDKLRPGMKAIAVSRDLLKMGLKRGARVRISGLEGEYVVLDKMNKRWTKRIDVYMGVNVRAALQYGKRNVVMHYKPVKPLLMAENNSAGQ